MKSLFDQLIEANERLYNEAEQPLRSHGLDHHIRVWHYAQELAKKLGVKFDEEVLAGACLLHDLAAYYPEKSGEDYHDYDHLIAGEVLEGIGFPENKRRAVLDAIKNHGSDPKFKRQNEPIETVLLRDGDKMDVFGPVGVARVVMVRTLKGDTLEQIVNDFLTRGHLQRKFDSITTPEARELVKADFGYSMDFFRRLEEGLKHE